MKSKRLGELALIDSFTHDLPLAKGVVKGVGDDCAVLTVPDNSDYLLATCDAQVENVHFTTKTFSPSEIGQKAIAVNVSDIAAMGGTPAYCLVSLIIPSHIDQPFLDLMYKGIRSACKKFAVAIAGGNISKGRDLIIDISMFGTVNKNEVLYRRGAKPGDKILVTGTLGNAAMGLLLLQNPQFSIGVKQKKLFVDAQHTPLPRLLEGQLLGRLQKVTSAIDISDGLVQDLGHICEQSEVGAVLEESSIPVLSSLRKISSTLGKDAMELALGGGEDYELLFTVPAAYAEEVAKEITGKTQTSVAIIGDILEKKSGISIKTSNGEQKTVKINGWDHLKI